MRALRCLLVASALLLHPAFAAAEDGDLAVRLGGGLVSFPGDVAVEPGATYGASLGLDVNGPVELELGYAGAAYAAGAGEGESAFENGGAAQVLVKPLTGTVEPYLLGGLSVSRLTVRGDGPESAVRDATLSKVPVGAGLDVGIGGFLLGARGSYSFLLDPGGAFPGEELGARDADQLSAQLSLGARF